MPILDSVNSAIRSVNDTITSAQSAIGDILNPGRNTGEAISLTYPLDLRSSVGKYPIVRFLAEDETRAEKEILLPSPQGGVSFSDGGQYGQIDLGIIAGSFADLARAQGDQTLRGAASEFWGKVSNTYRQGQASALLANIATDNQKIRFATGQGAKLLPPNTNTTFTNNTLRQFGFQFKLTASSPDGSRAIKDIIHTFRRLVYASNSEDEETLVLNYPPVWTISFLDGYSGALKENEYLPKIGKSYLTSLNTVYNASSNLFHIDGAPTEVDVTLTFQETKVYTRQEIDALERGDKI